MRPLLLLAALLPLCACSDTELVGLHVRLQADGSGTLTTRTLLAPTEAGPAEAAAQGITWESRAVLSVSQGTFRSLDGVRFGDLRFTGGTRSDDMPRLRVFVPRGPDVAWARALVPDLETRRRLARVYDPSGKQQEIAEALRIEVQFPDSVVSTGVLPGGRGVEADHERNRAFLIVPASTALEKGDEMVWDITWK